MVKERYDVVDAGGCWWCLFISGVCHCLGEIIVVGDGVDNVVGVVVDVAVVGVVAVDVDVVAAAAVVVVVDVVVVGMLRVAFVTFSSLLCALPPLLSPGQHERHVRPQKRIAFVRVERKVREGHAERTRQRRPTR